MNTPGAGEASRRVEHGGHCRKQARTPPAALLPWLEDPGSLTERMRTVCGADFRLAFLGQKHARPLASESRALDLPPRRFALIREVLLCRRDTPWIFARSVLPLPTLRGANRRIGKLGKRPLGDILFSNLDLHRATINVSSLRDDVPLHKICTRALGRDPADSWLRQSLFCIHKEPLLISEVFLPEIGME